MIDRNTNASDPHRKAMNAVTYQTVGARSRNQVGKPSTVGQAICGTTLGSADCYRKRPNREARAVSCCEGQRAALGVGLDSSGCCPSQEAETESLQRVGHLARNRSELLAVALIHVPAVCVALTDADRASAIRSCLAGLRWPVADGLDIAPDHAHRRTHGLSVGRGGGVAAGRPVAAHRAGRRSMPCNRTTARLQSDEPKHCNWTARNLRSDGA